MPPEKKVTVYGQEIHFYEKGKGPAVIFLHGMVGTSTDWAYTLGPLSRKYRVVALDQIGFGHSSKPPINYTVSDFADFLGEFMRVRGIPKAVIVGNSFGGWIACDFAATHPDLVDRLVLVDAAGLDAPIHRAVPVDMNPSTKAGMRRLWETLFYDHNKVTSDMVDYSWNRRVTDRDSDTIRRLVVQLVKGNEFEDAKIGSIKARTLIIWGHDDTILPLEAGQRLQKALPGSQWVVIDKCGHVPQLEKPAEFNRILLRFLSRP